ncbi:sialin-like [Penaeus indicus]|uniref:sialin-like n=1 Tax=Penaeus indicus TaxID=29960 RepID=UPI00300C9168
MPARLALAVMAWFGFINLYMVRINLSVIIVAMVRRNTTVATAPPCLSNYNSTHGSSGEHERFNTDEEGEMDWDETIQGLILAGFFYGYVVSQIPGGRMAELYGTRWVFGGCILAGGVCALLSPVAARAHYGAFIALRIVQGIFQGVSWPAMHSCISHWIPPLERPRITPEELKYIEETLQRSGTNTSRSVKLPLKSILRSMPVWAIIVASAGNTWGLTVFLAKLPTYMKNILGFTITEEMEVLQNGFLSALPFLLRYMGAIIWSSLGDWLTKRGFLSICASRRIFSAIALWGPAVMVLGVAHSGCNWQATVILICLALFCNGAVTASIIVNHTDIAPNFSGEALNKNWF